jgi:DNA replication protein DnaC
MESKEAREQRWKEFHLEKELQKLSPRICKVVKTLPWEEIKDVESTYLWGTIGSGKTIQVTCMMLAELKNTFMERKDTKAEFISIPELLLKFKNSYSNQKEEDVKITENDLIEKYSEIPFLVLDDFGVEKITDWSFQLLYIIINRRYENEKKTIFTSNFSLQELAERLGDDRIPSRIQQMCKVVKAKDVNYRVR